MFNQYLNNFKGIKKEKIKSFLEKKIKVNNIVYSMHEFIEKNYTNGAIIDKREYSTKKINLDYKKLKKPVLSYLIYIDENENEMIEIKKIGFDYYSFLVEKAFLSFIEKEIEKEREREAFLDLLDETLEELEENN